MTIASYEFEQSSESGRERLVLIPFSRLLDITPTKGNAACVNGLHATRRICGTVWNDGSAADPYAVLNVAEGRMELHDVRNVLTYAGGGAEAAWGPINIGDPIYYDAAQDALNGVKLSTAPLQAGGVVTNPFFGVAIMHQDETSASYPKGTNLAGSTQEVTILCAGLNTGV